MPYIPPNSTIKLLAGVPIDSSYDHTLWFSDANAQATYFNSKAVRSFSAVSYVRKGRGVIRIEAPADQLYACNYMMYQNTSYSNKWFYAFCIVEYVNDKTSQVTFIIDPLQTWLFDMQLAQSYVVREHSTTDVAGDNLIPEGLDTGEYIYEDNDLDWCHQFTSYDVVVYTTFGTNLSPGGQWSFSDSAGRYIWGIYSGLNIRVFKSIETQATIDSINGFVSAVTSAGKSDGIVAMIMIPHESLDEYQNPTQISHTIPKITSLDGYTPRNKKLLTSPYCFIEVQNCEGATAILPQEYFGGANPYLCQFMITFNITVAPVAVCVPINYKGAEYALQEAMYINNFSQCSWNTDLYKAYMAQSLTAKIGEVLVDSVAAAGQALIDSSGGYNPDTGGYESIGDLFKNLGAVMASGANTAGQLMNSVANSNIAQYQPLQGMLGVGVANKLVGGNVAGAIFSDLKQQYKYSVAAPHNNGANTPDYLTSNRIKGFWFYHRTIRREYAEIIDKYFDRFGYACHKVKIPNIHARAYWTYTKTIGCQVSGNIPADAVETIQNIFNNGITFWADPANFGNYALNNYII